MRSFGVIFVVSLNNAITSWWRHQMKTFSALLALCEGNPPVTDGFPSQRPVKRSFDIFFDVCPNKRLRKQSICGSFGTPLCSLWRHCEIIVIPLRILRNDTQTEACTHNMIHGQYFLYLLLNNDYLSLLNKQFSIEKINEFYILFWSSREC